VHHAIECLGLKLTAEQSFQMLAFGGTATLVGMVPFGEKIELHGWDFLRERKIQGSSMGSNRFRVDMPRLIELYMQGRLHLDDWISDRIKLEEINQGFKAMKEGRVVRAVIQFSRLTINRRINLTDLLRPHSLIKPRRIRVRGNLHPADLKRNRSFHPIKKQFFPNTGADAVRRYPQVLEFRLVATYTQRVKPAHLSIPFSNVNVIVANEIRSDREVCFPMFDPVFGISPVTLRLERNRRQQNSFIGSSASNHS
jgi:hypothetical protein